MLAHGFTEHVEKTLDAMAAGGIHDQLGGGFARYSVDAAWLVPHFEKMLYDNALLARTYLRAWQELGHPRYRDVCTGILDWVLREMRGPEGGFFSALDADSEGEEGRFYTWTPAEAHAVLGDAGLDHVTPGVLTYLGITAQGQLDGRSVVHLPAGLEGPPPAGLEQAKAALLAAREQRVRPGLDDKRLTSWNALMMGALAEAAAALGEPAYLEAAADCADFLLGTMRDERRPPPADVQRRQSAPQRLSRGLRLPGRGAARSLRGLIRAALLRGGPRDRGRDGRALRRPGQRRFLHDLR